MEFLPLTILMIIHLAIAEIMIYRTTKSILLSKVQKILNVILLILIPFFWSVLVFYILKREPDYFDERKHISNGDHFPPTRYTSGGFGQNGC